MDNILGGLEQKLNWGIDTIITYCCGKYNKILLQSKLV